VKFCQNNDISITAYAPLGSRGFVKKIKKQDAVPDLLENLTVLKIAEKYEKTPAQILLKHIIQKGIPDKNKKFHKYLWNTYVSV